MATTNRCVDCDKKIPAPARLCRDCEKTRATAFGAVK